MGLIKLGEALEKTPIHFRLDQKLATAWAKDPASISKIWSDFGGDPKVLGKTILSSVKTTINAREQRLISHPFMAFDSIEQGLKIHPSIGQASAVAAALAAAMPILLAIKKFLVTSKILTPNEANSMDSVIDSTLKLHGSGDIPAIDAKGNPIVAAGVATGDKGLTTTKKKSYLCTATCEYYGRDINTDAIYQSLLNFRETYVLKNERAKAFFKDYLKIAPALLEQIKTSNDEAIIYKDFDKAMSDCNNAVVCSNLQQAVNIYRDAVNKVINHFKK